jgi:sulfate/thiosulfate transport system substrate-binding protein
MFKAQSPWKLALLSMGLGMAIAGCSPSNSSQTPTGETTTEQTTAPEDIKITLVSYAVTQSAYEKIIPLFAEEWKAKTGQNVTVEQSYGGSGSQARAVIDGLEADIVALALALDTKEIEKAGLIEAGWESEFPNESIITRSVVALVPRDESIKLTSWQDLANDNIKVVTANPKTSGGARWNFLGFWGSVTQAGGSEAEATAFVEKIFKNVPVLPKNARESTDAFYKQGQGNVLMNYENEVLLAQSKGEKAPFFIPTDYNISIDNPITLVDKNVDKKGTREVAQAFAEFTYTPEAQRIFAEVGFRPTDPKVFEEFSNQYPKIDKLFTVKDLGGWDEIQKKFFDDGAIFDQVLQKAGK